MSQNCENSSQSKHYRSTPVVSTRHLPDSSPLLRSTMMASDTRGTGITCHKITSKDQCPETFRGLLALSISIFNPDTPEHDLPPQNRLATWEDHISLPGAAILYVSNSDSQPLGFFFAVPRTHPEIGHELLHLWLAGVDPASRGLGIFPLLTEQLKEHARVYRYGEMTVCTYPNRFTEMYRILGKNDWKEVAWPLKGEKVLMKLAV